MSDQDIYQAYLDTFIKLKNSELYQIKLKFLESITVTNCNTPVKIYYRKKILNSQDIVTVLQIEGTFDESIDKCKNTIINNDELKVIDSALKNIDVVEKMTKDQLLTCQKITMFSPLPIIISDLQVYTVQCIKEEDHWEKDNQNKNSQEKDSQDGINSQDIKENKSVYIYSCSDLFPMELSKKFEEEIKSHLILRDRISCLHLKSNPTDSKKTDFVHFSVMQLPSDLQRWMNAKDVARKVAEKLILAIQYFNKKS